MNHDAALHHGPRLFYDLFLGGSKKGKQAHFLLGKASESGQTACAGSDALWGWGRVHGAKAGLMAHSTPAFFS